MSEIVQIQLPSGQVVWARVSTTSRTRDAGLRSLAGVLSIDNFPETVAAVAESVRRGLRHLSPQEVGVEFGIEFHATAGGIISVLADTGGSASVKVQLTWSGAPREPADVAEGSGGVPRSPTAN
jgi:Trypsin-co-occurring domain 1